MARRLKVFAVSLLLACLFAFPANAEFSPSDSVDLGYIKDAVETIEKYSQHLDYLFYPYGSSGPPAAIYTFLSSLPSIDSKLTSILSALGVSAQTPQYDNIYLAYDSTFYPSQYKDSRYPFMVWGNQYVNFFYNSRPFVQHVERGSYSVVVNSSYPLPNGFLVLGAPVGVVLHFSDAKVYDSYNLYRYVFSLDVTVDDFNLYDVYIDANTNISYYASLYFYKIDDGENSLASSLSPSFSDKQSNLDDGIDQLESQEDSVFTSLDTSIGSLDFSGSALGQVVTGFTFIRAVFSAVYSSSPYISVLINLSCMLGVLALFLRVQPRFSRWEREHRDRDS